MKVYVYFNLHKHCWSIRHKNRVIAHTNYVELENAQFKVSKPGRERVLKTKQKNVHAFVCGNLVSLEKTRETEGGELVTYNPYKFETFVKVADETPVLDAEVVIMENRKVRSW